MLVGTSGYSFKDWVGPFYPTGMASSDFLAFYTRYFPVVEINATYYRIPTPQVMFSFATWSMEQAAFESRSSWPPVGDERSPQ